MDCKKTTSKLKEIPNIHRKNSPYLSPEISYNSK